MKKAFTLIEMLVVVLIIGILAAIALPSYLRSVERSRASEMDVLFGNVVKAQQLRKVKTGNQYTENWQALDSVYAKAPKGKVYCTKGVNTDEQKECQTDATYQVVLFGTDAPDMDAAVVATRKNNKQYGEYQLYRFYEGAPAKVYCKSDTKDGQELCMEYLETDTYVDPSRNPPNTPKQEIKREFCGTRCEMIYYDDGSKSKVSYNYDGSFSQRINYDAVTGNMTDITSYTSTGNFVMSRQNYDPTTGNRTDSTSYRSDGSVSQRDNYDPLTGKRISATYYDGAGGTLSHGFSYDVATGNMTDRTSYRADGSISEQIEYDPVTGKQMNSTSYRADGSVDTRSNYDPVTGKQSDWTFYKADGSVGSRGCMSGACKEPGYRSPPASSYRPTDSYPKTGSLCESYPGEKQCQ